MAEEYVSWKTSQDYLKKDYFFTQLTHINHLVSHGSLSKVIFMTLDFYFL